MSGSTRPPRLLVLASASPRRRDLLASIGVRCLIQPSDEDESAVLESPEDTVVHLAVRKASAIAIQRSGAYVLAADTLVVLDGETLGKPDSPDGARRMLSRLQGTSHQIMTGVALIDPYDGDMVTACEITNVSMRQVNDDEIDRYVQTGDPLDKAGAYAVQGQGRNFIRSLDGCFTNAIGLPLCVIFRWLGDRGFAWQSPHDPGCTHVGHTCPFQ